MFVTIPRRKSRFRFRLPPALFGMLAVFLIGVAALGRPAASRPAQAAPPPGRPPRPAARRTTGGRHDGADAGADDGEAGRTSPTSTCSSHGGAVMWILAAASVIAVAIIFERLYSLRRSQVIPPGFMPGLKAVLRDPRDERQRAAALEYCRANDSPIARMVAAFIKRLPRGFEAAEKAPGRRRRQRGAEAPGQHAVLLLHRLGRHAAGPDRHHRRHDQGVHGHGQAGDAGNKVDLLSTGIYEAMVCTFGGLAVAILVTLFYYFFVGRIEKLIGQINDELTRFSDDFGLNAESAQELGRDRAAAHAADARRRRCRRRCRWARRTTGRRCRGPEKRPGTVGNRREWGMLGEFLNGRRPCESKTHSANPRSRSTWCR